MKLKDRAAELWYSMAYNRKDYKNRLMEKIRGAIIHYYMIDVARRNHLVKWTKHWETEVERLLIELADEVGASIKGRWDRRKAAEEVIAEMREVDGFLRHRAATRVERHHKLRRVRPDIPTQVTEKFYRMVHKAVENGLAFAEFEKQNGL